MNLEITQRESDLPSSLELSRDEVETRTQKVKVSGTGKGQVEHRENTVPA